VVESTRCKEVVHGGAVLRAWSNRSERGQSGLWEPFIAARGGGRRVAWR
jgi:hypothetical protein